MTDDKQHKRADFSLKTRELTAQRAGYRCSFPGCNRTTVGPAEDPQKPLITGIAAHIYGAAISGGGPRGTGGLSYDELKSPQNAIWLCGHCASLIDKNRGKEYPPETLHSYKALHETRIAHEQAGIHTPFGWINKFTLHSSPLFSDDLEIEFAKLNLIVGENSVGKTALCEWIAGISNPAYLERWETLTRDSLKRLSYRVDYYNPDPHRIEVDFLCPKYPRYKLDGEQTFLSTDTIKVIFPVSIEHRFQEMRNDRDIVSDSMKLHPYELQAICDELANKSDFFKGARFEETDEGVYMHVEVQAANQIESRLLRLLASSECEKLMLELGIITATKLSITRPTLLILDADSWRIDTDWLKRYAEVLGSAECRFQTIVSTRLTDMNFDEVTWSGWNVIRLDGTPPDAFILRGHLRSDRPEGTGSGG
ncbi:MAG: hypothetical protein OXL41_15185 [Nitrospinae bacterium]|nr:hypothetical protein [Nitrospinota bacterium]